MTGAARVEGKEDIVGFCIYRMIKNISAYMGIDFILSVSKTVLCSGCDVVE
jgi:hypothetical protein